MQVVYVKENIAKLVETLAGMLTADGCVYLYNDAVAQMATQAECRALLDAALATHRLRAAPCELPLPPGFEFPHAGAYLLRIARDSRAPGAK